MYGPRSYKEQRQLLLCYGTNMGQCHRDGVRTRNTSILPSIEIREIHLYKQFGVRLGCSCPLARAVPSDAFQDVKRPNMHPHRTYRTFKCTLDSGIQSILRLTFAYRPRACGRIAKFGCGMYTINTVTYTEGACACSILISTGVHRVHTT